MVVNFIEAAMVLFSRPLGWAIIAVLVIMGLGAYAELQRGRRRTDRKCNKIKEGLR